MDVWCEKKKDMDLLLGNKIDAHLLFIKYVFIEGTDSHHSALKVFKKVQFRKVIMNSSSKEKKICLENFIKNPDMVQTKKTHEIK